MKAVRQFDYNHTDVLRHGDEHLAVILVLLLFLGPETDALQLGQAVYEHGAGVAEFLPDLFERYRRIFHNIMQQSRNN
ncbi:hypothetical protein D3C73_1266870 [compost metagenome]